SFPTRRSSDLSGALFGYRKYDSVPHDRQRAEIRFDVAKFDAVSGDLDLFIHAAFEKKYIVTEATKVTRAIRAVASMLKKSVGRQIRPSEITRAYIGSCDNDFTALICRYHLTVSIYNEDFAARHRASDWQRRISFHNSSIN